MTPRSTRVADASKIRICGPDTAPKVHGVHIWHDADDAVEGPARLGSPAPDPERPILVLVPVESVTRFQSSPQ